MSKKPDNTTPPATPPADTTPPATPPADTTPPATPPADITPPATPPAGKTYTDADLKAMVDDMLATERKKLEDEKDLTDKEKAEKRAETAEAQLRLVKAKDEVTTALKAAGAKSPDLLFAASQDKLQFDDNGKLKNLTALVEALKTSYADQFGVDKPDDSIDGGAGTSGGDAKITKESLSRMSPAEINALDWEVVKKVMSGA
jgi:hypothetical protein